jgi:hypothetical protein
MSLSYEPDINAALCRRMYEYGDFKDSGKAWEYLMDCGSG